MLAGSEPAAPHLFNTCLTYFAADDAVTDPISFKPVDGTIKITDIFFSKVGESPATRREAGAGLMLRKLCSIAGLGIIAGASVMVHALWTRPILA